MDIGANVSDQQKTACATAPVRFFGVWIIRETVKSFDYGAKLARAQDKVNRYADRVRWECPL